MGLTEEDILTASPRSKAYKLYDAHGLDLLVNPSGSRLWRMKFTLEAKEHLLSFGPHPLIDLISARAKRDEARHMLLEGIDPRTRFSRRRKSRPNLEKPTFGSVAEEYLKKIERAGRSSATLSKNRWLLEHFRPGVYGMQVRDVSPRDILEVLQRAEDLGNLETARRLRSFAGCVMRYAVATCRADHDPTLVLKGALIAPRPRPRSAILERHAFGVFLRRIDNFKTNEVNRHAIHLLTLLAPRPGELRWARWQEFDLAAGVWTLPAERMKMRLRHRTPLSPSVVSRLESLRRLTGHSPYLLPSTRSWKKPISENTLNTVLRRNGYGPDTVTAHGFRSTFATLSNESGLWHPDAIERALAHVERSDVRRAYVRGEYWDERVRLAEWWSSEVEAMRKEAGSGR